MAKDPAFYFYTGDFISDTIMWDDAQRGRLVLLRCLQHKAIRTNHRITKEELLFISKNDPVLLQFFKEDELGWYEPDFYEILLKRKNYSKSRSNNRLGISNDKNSSSQLDMKFTSSTYVTHMENEDENENISFKNIEEKKIFFNFLFEKYLKKTGRTKAFENYCNTVRSAEDETLIENALKNYKDHCYRENTDHKYILGAARFFLEWRDWIKNEEIEPPSQWELDWVERISKVSREAFKDLRYEYMKGCYGVEAVIKERIEKAFDNRVEELNNELKSAI